MNLEASRTRLSTGSRAALQVAATLAAAVVVYLLWSTKFRATEALVSVGLLHAVGLTDTHAEAGNLIGVFPPSRAGFLVAITPSCSSLPSLLSIGLLSSLLPNSDTRRWARGLGLSLGVIAAGNIVRISSSVAVGYVSGTASLVLFHDWVGSIFGFGYTLFGFMLLLRMLLPRTVPDPVRDST